MRRDVTPEQSLAIAADIHLAKTSWKSVSQLRASSRERSVSKFAVGPPDDPPRSSSRQQNATDVGRDQPTLTAAIGKPEPRQTANSRPSWPSRSPPASEPEACATGVAPACCGRTPNAKCAAADNGLTDWRYGSRAVSSVRRRDEINA